MTITAAGGRITKLDADGRPIGPSLPFGPGVVSFDVEESGCGYGDPSCPCQDGDTCHYVGPEPMTAWKTLTIDIVAYDLRTAYLIFGSRRIFGYPRPLAVNGQEYRRRVRRR